MGALKTVPAHRRAVQAVGLTACLLCGATALYGCKEKPRVRFIRACPVHTQPNHGAPTVGTTQPQHPYEILGQKDNWYRVEVFDNRNWGWTDCPTTAE